MVILAVSLVWAGVAAGQVGQAPATSDACKRGEALERLGRYEGAAGAYLKGLETTASLGCSREGLVRLDRSGNLCATAAALASVDRGDEANAAYVKLLENVPGSDCARKGATATDPTDFSDWLGGAIKDVGNMLIAAAVGALLFAFAVTVTVGIAARWRRVRNWRAIRWLQRPVIHIGELNDAAFNDLGLGPGTTAELLARVSKGTGLARQRVDLVSTEAAAPDALGGLSTVSPQAAAAAAFLTLVRAALPRVEWHVRGELQAKGESGYGLTIALRKGRRYGSFTAFWAARDAGPVASQGAGSGTGRGAGGSARDSVGDDSPNPPIPAAGPKSHPRDGACARVAEALKKLLGARDQRGRSVAARSAVSQPSPSRDVSERMLAAEPYTPSGPAPAAQESLKEQPSEAELFRRLTIPAAGWLDHQLTEARHPRRQLTKSAMSWALHVTAVHWQEQAKREVAKTYYWRALQLDPENVGALTNVGIALEADGDDDGAKEHLCQALRLIETRGARYNANWYRVKFSLAVMYANRVARDAQSDPRSSEAAEEEARKQAKELAEATVAARAELDCRFWNHPVRTVKRWREVSRGERKELEAFLRESMEPSAFVLYAARLPRSGMFPKEPPDRAEVTRELKKDTPSPEVFVKYLSDIEDRVPALDYNLACLYTDWGDSWKAAATSLRRSIERTHPLQRPRHIDEALKDPTLTPLLDREALVDEGPTLRKWLEQMQRAQTPSAIVQESQGAEAP